MRASSFVRLLIVAAVPASCTGATGVETPGRAYQAVVGEDARADLAHDAVVVVETAQGSLCSGTVIERNAAGDRLYVATAAHCCREGDPPTKIVIGPDYADPALSLPVDAFQAHPCYNPLSYDYDFCALTVLDKRGLNVTPIPMVSGPDELGPDDIVTVVGYGSTPAYNTIRRRALARLEEITPLTLVADQRAGSGGLCFGDSGGPFLIEQNGAEVVAGVISFGAPTSLCNVVGVAGRVSFPGVREQFFDRVLAGREPVVQSLLIQRNAGTAGPVRDTYLASDEPDRNFGDRVDLLVGTPPGTGAVREALLRFDLAGLPKGAIILTARVGLHEESRTGPGTITVHRVTRDWDELRETWASFGERGFDPTSIAVFSNATAVVDSMDEVWFDITDLASEWAAGTVANDGILLRQPEGEQTQLLSSEIGQVDERPWLHVCYLPPAVGAPSDE
jgi:hypothetical protein